MSTLKYTALALAIGASVSMTSPTQAQSRTFVVEGAAGEDMYGIDRPNNLWLIDNSEAIAGFRMIATYDDNLMFYKMDTYSYRDHIYYEDLNDVGMAFTSLRFEFLDSEGNVVEQSQIPMVPNLKTPVITKFDLYFNQDVDVEEGYEVQDEDLDVEFDFIEDGTYNADAWVCEPLSPMQPCRFHALDFDIDTNRGDAPLFTHDGTRLEPVTYLGNANFIGNFVYWQEINVGGGEDTSRYMINLDFDVHSIYFDADLDGVADEMDSCDASVTGGTVTFGEYDSGVENVMASNGCTVMDSYAACHDDGQSMYGGPTYCEMQVAYSLYRDGVVDYSDVRALRTALYNAYRSGAMR